MKKTFPLQREGRHPDRVLDALKHEEKAMIFRPETPPKNRPRSFKDW